LERRVNLKMRTKEYHYDIKQSSPCNLVRFKAMLRYEIYNLTLG
jgi:hypothetical protein